MAKNKARYTNDMIPVRDIKNGQIILDNGIKVTGVKIMPRNIFILDQQTQDAIIANLRTVYDMIDYEFWLIAADRPVDINVYLSQLELLYNNVSSPVIRKLIKQDINKANLFISNSVVDTEYYIFFRDKNSDLIEKRIRTLINNFANAGLVANQVTNEDLRMVLDNFLNGGTTTSFGTVLG